ncbi:hypothetical protein [Photobacterium damselae]|uniref:hypothetical protein n=1 Tax=Photobacterium damselae TaxID=38293 RepID=UPI00165E9674|nr:hypothetical protein [Photobacterium damselae]
MSIEETVFWGTISGVLATVFLWFCGYIFKNVVIPTYQKASYDGVDLKGRWTSVSKEKGATYTYQLDMKQSAHKVYGTAVITKSNSDSDYIQDFKFTGETWEGYLTLNMRSSTNISLSFVSGLFKIEDRGAALRGAWAYRTRYDNVENEDVALTRIQG